MEILTITTILAIVALFYNAGQTDAKRGADKCQTKCHVEEQAKN